MPRYTYLCVSLLAAGVPETQIKDIPYEYSSCVLKQMQQFGWWFLLVFLCLFSIFIEWINYCHFYLPNKNAHQQTTLKVFALLTLGKSTSAASIVKVSKPKLLTASNLPAHQQLPPQHGSPSDFKFYSPDLKLPTQQEMQHELDSYPTMTLVTDYANGKRDKEPAIQFESEMD